MQHHLYLLLYKDTNANLELVLCYVQSRLSQSFSVVNIRKSNKTNIFPRFYVQHFHNMFQPFCLGRLCPIRHASKYASFNAKARLWAVVNLCEPKGQTDPGTCYITIACCAPKCHKHLRRLLTFEHTLILFLYLVGQSVLGLQDRQTTFWDDMWKYFVDERRE